MQLAEAATPGFPMFPMYDSNKCSDDRLNKQNCQAEVTLTLILFVPQVTDVCGIDP
jgi:hypothetical protein